MAAHVRGMVNFPVNDPNYIDSREGGMFVYLVVLPNSARDYRECSLAMPRAMGGEVFLAVDKLLEVDEVYWTELDRQSAHYAHLIHRHEEGEVTLTQEELLDAYEKLDDAIAFPTVKDALFRPTKVRRDQAAANEGFLLRHFGIKPERREETGRDYYDGLNSTEYLVCALLGSTNWSGYDDTYFVCGYEDLTKEGKAMYDAIHAAYPANPIFLQTWLDT